MLSIYYTILLVTFLEFTCNSTVTWYKEGHTKSSFVPKCSLRLMLDEYFTSSTSREQAELRELVKQSPTAVLAYSKAQ